MDMRKNIIYTLSISYTDVLNGNRIQFILTFTIYNDDDNISFNIRYPIINIQHDGLKCSLQFLLTTRIKHIFMLIWYIKLQIQSYIENNDNTTTGLNKTIPKQIYEFTANESF
jgi:hypothetical protein